MVISAIVDDYVGKGNKLYYVSDGKIITVDKDYYYDVIGVYDNKLLYYKNASYFGEGSDNLKTFYLYDGVNSVKAFDLDIGYFEGMTGYEYDGGILINLYYESSEDLYKYDGKKIEKLKLPSPLYSIIDIDIVDDKAYIVYRDGEESFLKHGTIIDLK